MRKHSGLCDRTNFQKGTSESVQITFQNARTLKTEFLEPPLLYYQNDGFVWLDTALPSFGVTCYLLVLPHIAHLVFAFDAQGCEVGCEGERLVCCVEQGYGMASASELAHIDLIVVVEHFALSRQAEAVLIDSNDFGIEQNAAVGRRELAQVVGHGQRR